jgi:hypothetical protein
MDEIAKATQEIAKVAQKSVEAGEKLGSFLAKYLGEGFCHLGGTFSDWAQAYRYRNTLKLIDEIEKIHKTRCIEGKIIPILPKFALPILQEASLEDDDQVRSMWAGLLANTTDPNKRFQLRKLYIEILSSLDPVDVQVLQFLEKEGIDEEYGFLAGAKLNADELSNKLQCDGEDIKISLSNLNRHGLIIDSWESSFDNLGSNYLGMRVNNPNSNFRLSHLGRTLLSGCATTT